MSETNIRKLPVDVHGLMCEAHIPESVFDTEWDELPLSIDQIYYQGVPINLWQKAVANFQPTTNDSHNSGEPS